MKQNSTVLANAVKRTWVRLALTSGSVVLFSQVYFSTIGDGFRISATPVIYPILLIRLGSDRRCPLAGAVTFLTVLIVRCIIACMQGSALPAALLQEYHGGLFYFCYDAILCLLISDRRAVRPPRLLASLFLCDMASNLLDFMVSGHHLLLFTADRSAAARIVGIGFALALSRALAASTVLWFLSLREQALIHQQESARYQQLFVMAADLKTELYFLKKDAEDIEKVTLKAYQIYEQLCALPEQKALAALSLSVARDMHEIKKDNLRIIRGLESEVQGAYACCLLSTVARTAMAMHIRIARYFRFSARFPSFLSTISTYSTAMTPHTSITIHMVKLIPNNIFFSILRPRPFAETAAYFNNTTFGAGQKTIHPAPKVKR